MNNAVFKKKTVKNVRKHIDIKLVTTKRRRSVLASEPNHHTTKFFRESNSNKNEITEILMDKPVYLRLSTPGLSKIFMYELWHDYVKSKYGEKAKFCCIETDPVSLMHSHPVSLYT